MTGLPAFVGLGGTGVIGMALAQEMRERGVFYLTLSLSPDAADQHSRNICIDLRQAEPTQIAAIIATLAQDHEIVGILDIIGLQGEGQRALAAAAADVGAPVGVISSTLLYDHDGTVPVDETCPSITQDGAHPYQATKLKLEQIWKEGAFSDWTLFRTHHILGRGSLLGCIPGHNRDPDLLALLGDGQRLSLAHRGRIRVSFVHPRDLAALAYEILSRRSLLRKVVNLVHPEPVLASDYYALICHELGVEMRPPRDFAVDPGDFWAATARGNVFCSRFEPARSYGFRFGIAACIRDAMTIRGADYENLGQHLRDRILGRPQ